MPARCPFWSVSVYDRSGQNIYSFNDRTPPDGNLDFVVLTPAQMIELRKDLPDGIREVDLRRRRRSTRASSSSAPSFPTTAGSPGLRASSMASTARFSRRKPLSTVLQRRGITSLGRRTVLCATAVGDALVANARKDDDGCRTVCCPRGLVGARTAWHEWHYATHGWRFPLGWTGASTQRLLRDKDSIGLTVR